MATTTERMSQALRDMIELVGHDLADRYISLTGSLYADCESPIEKLLATVLAAVPTVESSFRVQAQSEIGKYRADFLVTLEEGGMGPVKIVVECDGHDFHEKTKQQAARDKKRDRTLLAQGYPTVRFTGSEIYRDPIACLKDVLNALEAGQIATRGAAAEGQAV